MPRIGQAGQELTKEGKKLVKESTGQGNMTVNNDGSKVNYGE